VHSFTGSKEELAQLLEMEGIYIGMDATPVPEVPDGFSQSGFLFEVLRELYY
jgi:hypothetical protein